MRVTSQPPQPSPTPRTAGPLDRGSGPAPPARARPARAGRRPARGPAAACWRWHWWRAPRCCWLVAWFLAGVFGSGTVLWLGALAMVPLALCLLGLRWVDRWDPEPRALLALGLLWGAGASVAGALLVGDVFTELFFDPAGALDMDLFGAVVQAPIVEELAKGAGVLLIFWINRAHFDGPMDGIVYGGMVGAGFAFTENILYFGSSHADPAAPGELVAVFVLRGLFSPFAHVHVHRLDGFRAGAVRRARQRGAAGRCICLLGLVPAMAGHFLWNGGVGIFFDDFLSFYFLLQVPLFVAIDRGRAAVAARRAAADRTAAGRLPAQPDGSPTRRSRCSPRARAGAAPGAGPPGWDAAGR